MFRRISAQSAKKGTFQKSRERPVCLILKVFSGAWSTNPRLSANSAKKTFIWKKESAQKCSKRSTTAQNITTSKNAESATLVSCKSKENASLQKQLIVWSWTLPLLVRAAQTLLSFKRPILALLTVLQPIFPIALQCKTTNPITAFNVVAISTPQEKSVSQSPNLSATA